MTHSSKPKRARASTTSTARASPSTDEIEERIGEILDKMDVDKVWINPDCGLKTRGNAETWPSLEHMVEAARRVRARL